MAKEEIIDMIVEGGKATTTPAIAQKLGPMKIPIPNVMSEINKKTENFKGMKIPVKLKVNPETKEFIVEVGSPSASELIKKELNLEKGSGTPNKIKSANMAIEQAIKIAKMKHDALLSRDLKASVKQIIGSCNSLGIIVEGKSAHNIIEEINAGKYDSQINAGKIDVSKEKLAELKQQLDNINEELKKAEAAQAAAAEAEKPKVAEEAAKEGAEAGKEAKPGEKAPEGKEAKPAAGDKKEEKKPAEKPKK